MDECVINTERRRKKKERKKSHGLEYRGWGWGGGVVGCEEGGIGGET